MPRSKKPAQQQSETEGLTLKRTPTRRTPSPETERPVGPLSVVSSQDRDVVKVNNASATDLKNACDDAVKRVRVCFPYLYKKD